MKRALTMQRIADELGLSRVLVSSVINGKALDRGFSKKTIAKVEAHLAKRGFVPSRQALELRRGAAGKVGILHCGKLYSHLTEAFNLLVERLVTSPETLELMVIPMERLTRGVRELLSRGVSRLIWVQIKEIAVPPEILPGLVPYLRRFDRVILYNHHFAPGPFDAAARTLGAWRVGVDRDAAWNDMAAFLKSLGHRVVAFNHESDVMNRAFRSHGFQTPVSIPERPSPLSPARLVDEVTEAIVRGKRDFGVTAAALNDDDLAGCVIEALAARGLQVPRDLTLTGFDGMPYAANFRAPLTTLRIPVEALVSETIDALANGSDPLERCLPVELVKRASHAPPAK